MKQLRFGEGHLSSVLRGKKKITIRRFREEAHKFQRNEIVIGVFEDGPNIALKTISDTEVKPFSELTDTEAEEGGFEDAEDAFEKLKQYYPDLKKEDLAGIIRFEPLKFGRRLVIVREIAKV